MKLDIKIINEYVEKGLLLKQKHPEFPIYIYNYSRKVQYEKLWDDITLMARGLILDDNGNVIAKGFDKFFNLDQLESVGLKVPNEDFEVYDKMDGSYICCFFYNNRWIISSKGSFTSDQAQKGYELLNKYDANKLDKKNSYIFEIIY